MIACLYVDLLLGLDGGAAAKVCDCGTGVLYLLSWVRHAKTLQEFGSSAIQQTQSAFVPFVHGAACWILRHISSCGGPNRYSHSIRSHGATQGTVSRFPELHNRDLYSSLWRATAGYRLCFVQ